jgi:hypothetical protein
MQKNQGARKHERKSTKFKKEHKAQAREGSAWSVKAQAHAKL